MNMSLAISKNPTIETEHLKLRPFNLEDCSSLHDILSQEGVLRYFPNPNPPTLEKVEKFIRAQLNHWDERGFGWWAVELRHVEQNLAEEWGRQSLIGWNGLQFLPDTDEVEIGYLLARPFWGRGLAAEGALPAVKAAFEELGLDEIVGIVHPQNTASMRVLEKIGMSFTREAEYFGMPVRRYAMQRESWLG